MTTATLQPWQERVIKERDELTEKLNKLTDALASRRWPPRVFDQLMRQHTAMSNYEQILAERIADF